MGYFSLPSLAHYLILDPERRVAIHHKRGQGDIIEIRIPSEGVIRLDPPRSRRRWRKCSRRREAASAECSAQSCNSIRTGTWSEALSRARIGLSIVTLFRISAACGDNSRWSMRMPLFRCQAPA
jgi:hypothetical protein